MGKITVPTGTKRVPTKTATSKRARRAGSFARWRPSLALSSFSTLLRRMKIGVINHSWQRMPYLEFYCTFNSNLQMS